MRPLSAAREDFRKTALARWRNLPISSRQLPRGLVAAKAWKSTIGPPMVPVVTVRTRMTTQNRDTNLKGMAKSACPPNIGDRHDRIVD
jgi:hypothetical protein